MQVCWNPDSYNLEITHHLMQRLHALHYLVGQLGEKRTNQALGYLRRDL